MVNETDEEGNQKSEDKSALDDQLWMLKECDDYRDEYKECTSLRGRFHQYFIYGETLNCNQWKKDYENCKKFRNNNDTHAGELVIESEKQRRMERLSGHYGNTTWKKRPHPPEDWNKPLPEWMAKRDENTYLAFKANELKENPNLTEEKDSFCVVM